MTEALDEMESPSVSTRDFQAAHLRFHQVLLDRYPPTFGDLIAQLHSRIDRSQRRYFSRPASVSEFSELDRLFLEAVAAGRAEQVRQILEFHLIDAALGVIIEVLPDYPFDKLAVSLTGLGIEVEGIASGMLIRPARITWTRGPSELPTLRTSSLHHEPEPSPSTASGPTTSRQVADQVH